MIQRIGAAVWRDLRELGWRLLVAPAALMGLAAISVLIMALIPARGSPARTQFVLVDAAGGFGARVAVLASDAEVSVSVAQSPEQAAARLEAGEARGWALVDPAAMDAARVVVHGDLPSKVRDRLESAFALAELESTFGPLAAPGLAGVTASPPRAVAAGGSDSTVLGVLLFQLIVASALGASAVSRPQSASIDDRFVTLASATELASCRAATTLAVLAITGLLSAPAIAFAAFAAILASPEMTLLWLGLLGVHVALAAWLAGVVGSGPAAVAGSIGVVSALGMAQLVARSPEAGWVVVGSWLPVVGGPCLFARFGHGSVSTAELVLALGFALVSAGVLGWLMAEAGRAIRALGGRPTSLAQLKSAWQVR